ncbi:hypothetical protein V6N13_026664 [Hibiscus sabdariffa]|uniref:Rhamnogalacturonan lyase domain-containing protein n=1 Tax=Hibiscus sabdariffa TaxID=183260 RepID=A0ABR2BU52_9ROSI
MEFLTAQPLSSSYRNLTRCLLTHCASVTQTNIDNTVCGIATQIYKVMAIWFILLALVTILRIGSLLMNLGNNTLRPTTWQIKYNLQEVTKTGTYTLQLALASASFAEVQVRFNDPDVVRPHFTTGE